MSVEALEAKRQQMKDYFELHPDSRDITVVGADVTFKGLFDKAYKYEEADDGNVPRRKFMPHITFFSGVEVDFKARVTHVEVAGNDYIVYNIDRDQTEETFQGELWLV